MLRSHLWVDEAEPRREIVIDYTLGGNPGNARSRDTPRGSPGNARSRDVPVLSSDGQVILFGEQLVFPPGTFYSIQGRQMCHSHRLGRLR